MIIIISNFNILLKFTLPSITAADHDKINVFINKENNSTGKKKKKIKYCLIMYKVPNKQNTILYTHLLLGYDIER